MTARSCLPFLFPAAAAAILCGDPRAAGAADADYKSILVEATRDAVEIRLPLTNVSGPARVKRRADDGFGLPLAPTKADLDERCYLEWQIGYDTTDPNDVSVAPGIVFQRDGRTKYGSEFTKILAGLLAAGIVTRERLETEFKELAKLKEVDLEAAEKVNLRPVPKTDRPLPDGFERFVQTVPHLVKTTPFAAIEIQFKPKHRAVGYQPMVYVCLPLAQWRDESGAPRGTGKARSKETVIYRIDARNAGLASDIIRAFGMASREHNEDLTKILEALLRRPQ